MLEKKFNKIIHKIPQKTILFKLILTKIKQKQHEYAGTFLSCEIELCRSPTTLRGCKK